MRFSFFIRGLVVFCFFSITSCAKKTSTHLISKSDLNSAHRTNYKKGFLNDQRSPLKTESETSLLDFFSFNEMYDVNCKFIKTENPQSFDMPTYSGTSKAYIKFGTAQCPINEKVVTLALYKSAIAFQNPIYQDHLFLPFKDDTNDDSTYGGGNIDLNIHDIINDSIRIDFNKCYNPWCAYSDGYNCPIPPKENHLALSINAGEKKYKGEVKKK